MTTIAYKDGIIAYDSRATAGGRIVSDGTQKKSTRDGVTFFISGAVADRDAVMEAWFEGDGESELGFQALAVDEDGVVWTFGGDEDEVFRVRADEFGAVAAGSGAAYALAAMDCGLSAKEAVKMAAKRDTSTGGKIRMYRVK